MEREHKLIREIQRNGSRSAADELIGAYYDEIYIFAYRQTGSKEDAMDLTQEIFIAILRSLQSYDNRKAAFRTWLYRIASNKIIDSRRKVRPEMTPIEDEGLADEEDYVSDVCDKVLLEQIERYVSGLDPEIQTVFRLHLYGEKSFPEIAAIQGQPEAAVKARYYRLMHRLRKEFCKHDEA